MLKMDIWIEKFRPKKFDEVVGQNNIIEEIERNVKNNNLSHLIFYGSSGVGKTTVAYIIGRELYGSNFRSNFIELNASDERGIDTIREKVKGFAMTKALGADFKIILLDEADYLTDEAQASLRRIMEVYSAQTRFILCCNDINKIIQPIKSRCVTYKFDNLEESDVRGIITRITLNQPLYKQFTPEIINNIIKLGNGDLRKVINILQSICLKDKIDIKGVTKESGYLIKEIIDEIRNKDFIKVRMNIQKMIRLGWDERKILIEMREYIINDKDLDSKLKARYLLLLMKTDERMVLGVNKVLVFDGLIVEMIEE